MVAFILNTVVYSKINGEGKRKGTDYQWEIRYYIKYISVNKTDHHLVLCINANVHVSA